MHCSGACKCSERPFDTPDNNIIIILPIESLIVPKFNLKTYGYRAFSNRAPTLWNALPDDIRQVELPVTFKSKLKTHLFRQFFH